MFRSVFVSAAAMMVAAMPAAAQQGPVNGMRPVEIRAHAITNATVVVSPDETLEGATVVIRDGVIESVGTSVSVPADARVWDGTDLYVYPGLIESALMIEVEHEPTAGSHWNKRVHPEIRIADGDGPDASTRKGLRELGFTAAAVYPKDGSFRGIGAVMAMGDEAEDLTVYERDGLLAAALEYSGGWSERLYPASTAGAVALVRQTLVDAQWHARCSDVYDRNPQGNEPPLRADALAALRPAIEGRQTILFEAQDEHDAQRIKAIADTFNLDWVMLGGDTAFRRLDDTVSIGVPIILPINFPKRPEIDSLSSAESVSLREMQTWEQSPTNPRRLIDAGATVALTTHDLKSRKDVYKKVREAIKHGLTERDALAALTTTPASMLGLDDTMGTVSRGKIANLMVTDKPLFEKKMEIRDVWVDGQRHEINAADDETVHGKGELTLSRGESYPVEFNSDKKTVVLTLPGGDDDKKKTLKAKKVIVSAQQMSFVLDAQQLFDMDGWAVLSGAIDEGDLDAAGDEVIRGSGLLPDGERFRFTMNLTEPVEDDDDDSEDADDDADDEEADDDDAADDPVAGLWAMTIEADQMPQPMSVDLEIDRNDDGSLGGSVSMMGREIDLDEVSFDESSNTLTMSFPGMRGDAVTVTGSVDGDAITGTLASDMFNADISASRGSSGGGDDEGDDEDFVMPPDQISYPLGAYGLTEPPTQQSVLITNATIWTAGPRGMIENGWMIVNNGRVDSIGSGSAPGGSFDVQIDAESKHITPGLIDCHSHTGIHGGVNEWTQTNSAEVRISDCVQPDDIDWYRQLAGGLTAANQLHGSANPIGGQNSVVKLKWGGNASDFRFDEAKPGIKFALGENVKRSENRYPDTRMGVETFIRDAFTAAKEYEAEHKRYNAMSSSERGRAMPPQRDLELETLVEILNGERMIHCHSYRQDEILMLIRLADDFGFTIGTFQHVLEGYKVADAIAEHGAGASSFSDWWMYKMEVMDAVPFNGTLMTNVGVNVSFNSDSDELARRMNIEAAKAVRYGGMDPHEALKLVTINPAWQLGIDHRTGSLEAGKDADFVIWSDNPLSTYARCEQTWIEGAKYFDIEEDKQRQAHTDRERQRLVQKILTAQHGTGKKKKGDDADDEDESTTQPALLASGAPLPEVVVDYMLSRVQLGENPDEVRPGECGCGTIFDFLMDHHAHSH